MRRIYNSPEWPESLEIYEPGDEVVVVIDKSQMDHQGDGHEAAVLAIVTKTVIRSHRVLADSDMTTSWPEPLYDLTINAGPWDLVGKKAKIAHSAIYRDYLDYVYRTIGKDAMVILNKQQSSGAED